MKLIELKETLYRPGEYLVGVAQTHSHACYLIYGTLNPGEERELSPGAGHEEIFCLIHGELVVSEGDDEQGVKQGQCFHLAGEVKVILKNNLGETAIYVLAGGHSSTDSHAH